MEFSRAVWKVLEVMTLFMFSPVASTGQSPTDPENTAQPELKALAMTCRKGTMTSTASSDTST